MDTGGTSVVVRGGCGGAGVIVSSAGGTYGRSADQSNRQTQFAFVATAVALQWHRDQASKLNDIFPYENILLMPAFWYAQTPGNYIRHHCVTHDHECFKWAMLPVRCGPRTAWGSPHAYTPPQLWRRVLLSHPVWAHAYRSVYVSGRIKRNHTYNQAIPCIKYVHLQHQPMIAGYISPFTRLLPSNQTHLDASKHTQSLSSGHPSLKGGARGK